MNPQFDKAQDAMRSEYTNRQQSLVLFRHKMKRAIEEGLLLFIKYALVVVLAYFAVNFISNVVGGSVNGTQAILYINQAVEKGYLPKVQPNGQLPEKEQK